MAPIISKVSLVGDPAQPPLTLEKTLIKEKLKTVVQTAV